MWAKRRKPRDVFRARGFLIWGGLTARRSSGMENRKRLA